jgi:hypothetical protein
MTSTVGLAEAFAGLSFTSPLLLAPLMLGKVAVFYAFYLRQRRSYR